MKRLIMVLIFLAIGASVAGGYWYWQQSQQSAADGAKAKGGKEKGKGGKGGKGGPLTVKAVRAVVKPMPVLIEAVGTVEAEQSVQVRAQVSGVLQKVSFSEGDKVKAGQLLFQIDPRTFQAQYNQAVAALARDRAQLENARAQEQRLAPLLKREFITRQEYDVAVTSAKSLEATVQAGQAAVEQSQIQLGFSRIVAPIGGRTGQLAVKPGNLVLASGSGVPLVTINSTDPVLVGFSIPERQLEVLRRYQNEKDIRIEILPDRAGLPAAVGKLVFIDNTVTPQTGTVLLKTKVDNTKELIWPGQFVNVRVVLTVEPEAVVVPEVAVQPGQDGPFVYLVDADNKVEVRSVKVARQVGGEIVIASGVKGGDHVITEIPQALRPGGTVKISDGTENTEPRKGKGKGGKKGEGKGKSEGKAGAEAKSEGEAKSEAKVEGEGKKGKAEAEVGSKEEGKKGKGKGKNEGKSEGESKSESGIADTAKSLPKQ